MQMTDADWGVLKHFTESENWGEPAKMSADLVYELDAFRGFVNTPIVVSCGTNKGHVSGSFHPLGLAVDILFPDRGVKDLPDLFVAACRYGFRGIGLYNHWQYQGKVVAGMHLDYRPGERIRAFWLGVLEPDPKVGVPAQVYQPLTLVNLHRHGFL